MMLLLFKEHLTNYIVIQIETMKELEEFYFFLQAYTELVQH